MTVRAHAAELYQTTSGLRRALDDMSSGQKDELLRSTLDAVELLSTQVDTLLDALQRCPTLSESDLDL